MLKSPNFNCTLWYRTKYDWNNGTNNGSRICVRVIYVGLRFKKKKKQIKSWRRANSPWNLKQFNEDSVESGFSINLWRQYNPISNRGRLYPFPTLSGREKSLETRDFQHGWRKEFGRIPQSGTLKEIRTSLQNTKCKHTHNSRFV